MGTASLVEKPVSGSFSRTTCVCVASLERPVLSVSASVSVSMSVCVSVCVCVSLCVVYRVLYLLWLIRVLYLLWLICCSGRGEKERLVL